MSSIETIPERWAAAWSRNDPTAFASLFSPDATYTDHAFQIFTKHIDQHHQKWLAANPDFKLVLDPSTPVWWAPGSDMAEGKNASCSFRTINTGTFTGDLPTLKASGNRWCFPAMVHMVIKYGLIVQLDEFYREGFDKGVGVENYVQRH